MSPEQLADEAATVPVEAVTRLHVFTVDVEEYFHVSAFERHIQRSDWEHLPSRVESATLTLLDLLARSNSTGTFFVLGWVAERNPKLVRRIAEAGHEVASHGWWHQRVTMITRDAFHDDVRRARELLSDIIGAPVLGYRAPSFSIVPGREWAFDALLEAGYRYDSSIFPIRRSSAYGWAGAPDAPYAITRSGGTLLELPLTPLRIGGARVPACGGAYFRHLPYTLTRRTLLQCEARSAAGVFYTHPWELDGGQPRVATSWLTQLRHYGGIRRTQPRLQRMLAEFSFTSAARVLGLESTPTSRVPAGGV